jgi:hypothetical protein
MIWPTYHILRRNASGKIPLYLDPTEFSEETTSLIPHLPHFDNNINVFWHDFCIPTKPFRKDVNSSTKCQPSLFFKQPRSRRQRIRVLFTLLVLECGRHSPATSRA